MAVKLYVTSLWKGRTLKLFIQSPTACDTQSTYELFEVDRSILVYVEYIEDVVCKLGGIAKGKELFVDATKFGFVELTRWTVFTETLIPEKA